MNAFFSIFSNPWILVWLPLAALPVLIHLWNRRKHREAPWAAMEYLLAAIEKNSRRVRIEQLLLLLIRTAIVLLVVFALAKPFISSLASRLVGERRHQVFVIDASYSMQFTPADRSLLEMAKEQVMQLVDDSGQGDGFSLVLMADKPRVVVGKAVFDKSAFRDEVAALMPIDGGADLAETLSAVEKIIADVRRDQPQLASHSVKIFSDLQRTSWDAAVEKSDIKEKIEQRMVKLRERGPVEVVTLGTGGEENLAITRLSIAEPFATIRQPVRIQAVAHNFSSQPRSQLTLELLVDERRIESKPLNLPARGSAAPIQFLYQFETPGEHAVEVILTGDSLAVDNRRYLSVPVKAYLNALLVSGKQGSAEPLAFSLETDFELDSRLVKPEVVNESAITELDLRRYDCIFLFNVAQFTSAEAQLLDAYLRDGGGLIFFLGDQVIAERYNEMLAGDGPESPRVLPAKLATAKITEPLNFDSLDYQHPLLGAWKDQPDSGLLSARTWKYFPLDPLPESENGGRMPSRVALAFSNGDAAIVEAPIHRGRSIVVATAASPESVIDVESRKLWSDLFRAELLTPLGQELWRFAVGSQQHDRTVTVGDSIGGPLPAGAIDSEVEVMPPSEDDTESLPRQARREISRWSYDATPRSGLYRVSFEIGSVSELFAVNVNPTEGDLSRIEPRDLPGGMARLALTEDAAGDEVVYQAESAPIALHKWMLFAVLTLLLTESLYAWWLGVRAE